MSQKQVIIYCRYSSDMQRPDSCADQERAVRAGLAGLGVPTDAALVIRDEAESGTKADRAGFRQLRALVARGAVAVLAVDDQSRLSRGDGAYQFVQDLVFAGGRFVSTGEGIDTDVPGWELKVQVLQLHHGQTVRDLRHRVRRGQRGRVEADGSAGDFPYGYESYYLDDDWAAQLARRGPKPKKGVRVCAAEAEVVRRVFDRFVAGTSINGIARELTRLKVPKGRRASKPGWHPQRVHRILTNAKYVGAWAWGRTATVRDSQGRKKQTAVAADEVVVRARPELRIVEQVVWDRARARFAELDARYGHTEGQKRRGPLGGDEYPRSPLGGLLTCAACGARMWQRRAGSRRYYACSGAPSGRCSVTAQVPADRAERALTDLVFGALRGWPEWVRDVYRRTCAAVRAAAERVPEDRSRDQKRRAELDRAIDNVVAALANGLDSPAVRARLRADEAERAEVEKRLAGYAALGSTAVDLPDEEWVAARLAEWAERAASTDGPGALLRHALEALTAEPVVAIGKARGFVRLRVRVRAWAALAAVLGDALRVPPDALSCEPDGTSPEFVVDLGGPTPMDAWAERIAEWRAAGVTWPEIVRRTGLDLNRAYRAWKRFTDARAAEERESNPPA